MNIQLNLHNATSVLSSMTTQKLCTVAPYKYTSPKDLGYDQNGNPIWACRCLAIHETGTIRVVFASSKEAAKRGAAYLVCCEILEVNNEYGITGNYGCWQFADGKLLPEHMVRKCA